MVRTVVGRAQSGVSEGLNGPYVLSELPSPSKASSQARKLVLVGELSGEPLDWARRAAGLTHGELYRRYFELGGMSSPLEVEAFCYGVLQPDAHDHDVIAHALNERFVELGGDHRVPYSDEP